MTQITLRSGTAAEWTSANTLLAEAEAGFETDTGKLKFGNGVTPWASLPYFSPNSHTHDAAAITSGYLDFNRLTLANATDRGAMSSGDWAKLQNTLHIQKTTPAATDAPSTYPYGTSYFELSAATGWPWGYGTVYTMRANSINPRGFQILVRKDVGGLAGEQWVRTEHDGDTWSIWNQTHADNVPKLMTFMSSWADFNGATYSRLKATQVTAGVISISGMIKGGTLQDGIGVATVPTLFRPVRDVYASCTIRNSTGTINAAGMAVVRRITDANPGQLQIFGITSTTTYVCLGFTYNIDGD